MTDVSQEQRLRRLELTVTRRLDGLLRGQYAGLLPGAGTEVSGSREYRPGEDEVRRMDWAVTARTGLPHVRETIADRELTVWVLVDATPSMDFGTALVEKRELAVSAVAAVGFLTAGHGNRFGASVMSAAGVRRFPARTGRAHLLGLLRTLLALPRGEPGAAPSLADSVEGLNRALRRRELVVVVSDFLDTSWSWELPLRRLALRHQVIAVEVMDPQGADTAERGRTDGGRPGNGPPPRRTDGKPPRTHPLRGRRRGPEGGGTSRDPPRGSGPPAIAHGPRLGGGHRPTRTHPTQTGTGRPPVMFGTHEPGPSPTPMTRTTDSHNQLTSGTNGPFVPVGAGVLSVAVDRLKSGVPLAGWAETRPRSRPVALFGEVRP